MNVSEKRCLNTTINIINAIGSRLSEEDLTVLIETGNCNTSLPVEEYVRAQKIYYEIFALHENLTLILRRECKL